MKKLLFVAIAMIASLVNSYAEDDKGVKFFQGTFQEALAESEAQGLPLLMDVYAVWCPPCKYMTTTVFPTEEAGSYINKNYVAYKIDGETEDGKKVMAKYGIKAYPTFLVLSSDGKEIKKIVGGAKTAEDFIKRLTEE